MPTSCLSAGSHPATEEAGVRGQRVRVHMLPTGRGRGPDRVLGELLVLDVRLHHMTCRLSESSFNPLPPSSFLLLLPKPPPPPPPPQHHSCQTGKTNQLWLLFPINHGIMQTGNSNKMQTSGKTGTPNQTSHLHPAASLPDQSLLTTPLTPAEVAPPLERVSVAADGR